MPSDSQEQSGEWGREKRLKHARAREEYVFRREYGFPSAPFYVKCLCCGWTKQVKGLTGAVHDSKMHTGHHGGVEGQHAQVVVLDQHGRELRRQHAIYREDDDRTRCEFCDEPFEKHRRNVCPSCGNIQSVALDEGDA
jgi:hypothetical protein